MPVPGFDVPGNYYEPDMEDETMSATQPAATVGKKPFYGAQCPSYPACTGGCGVGCTHEVEQARSSAAIGDATLYVERSKVRGIVIGHNAATQAVLSQIDALPIFTAEDFTSAAQPSAGNARLTELAHALVALQEDMPSADVRNCLGEAAHYLEKFAAVQSRHDAQPSAGIEEPHDLPFHKETMSGLDTLTIRAPAGVARQTLLADLREWQHHAAIDPVAAALIGDAADEIDRLSSVAQPSSDPHWQARPPHSDWRRIAPEFVDEYRAKDWEVRFTSAAQPSLLRRKLEEIHDITQDTTLGVECWQKLQNIAATAASALTSTQIETGK